MKFEKLNESNGKGRTIFLYGLITGVGLLIIFNLFLTKAKYKVVDNVKLVNSTISYSNADLNVIAMYIKEDDTSDYEPIETIPEGNYDIDNEKSYCMVPNNEEHIKDKITYDGVDVNIKISKKGTKCYVYLKKAKPPTADDTLKDLGLTLSNSGCPTIGEDGLPTEALTLETSNNGYLCEGVDNYGKTYYFRGHKEKVNNWVKMGSTYWRIIRINGDGSIRLIYNGTSATQNSGIASASIAYNITKTDNRYVGFMYGDTSGDYAATTANIKKSNILAVLDNALYNTVVPSEYKELLDENAGFCNDRTPYNGNSSSSIVDTNQYGFGGRNTYYGAYMRVETNKKPTFKCLQQNDLFTKEGSEKGNKKLTNPIGLITADEVMYAGTMYGTKNTSYWLYNGSDYWTMSPRDFGGSDAHVFLIYTDGTLISGLVSNSFGVRPVINLKASTKFTTDGNGTNGNPFVVKLD